MSGTKLLRELVNERLAAAAEEIFGLVERTIVEYQDEAIRSKREIIHLKQQIEQLTVLNPKVVLFRADSQPVSEELPPSLHQYDIKMEEIPPPEETEVQEHPQFKEEQVDHCISEDMKADTYNAAEVKIEINQVKHQIEQLTDLKDEVTLFRPETPLHGHRLPPDRSLSAIPATDDKKLLTVSRPDCQMTQFAAEVKQQVTAVNTKLLSMEERMAAFEAKVTCGHSAGEVKRKRRAHNPKLAKTVRRLHNSEANCKRYKPEQGLTSPHNEEVTLYLVQALAACPDLRNVDNDVILSACKTYYETVRRNFRYSQPDLAAQAEVIKSSARSRQRRKRLLEARQSVLAADEMSLWRGITIDMMSDEEDGTFGGFSGWIVRPPSFRSQELTDLCATLQARLEACPKYITSHHKRLHTGPNSDRMPPNTYDSEAAKKHFKAHMMPRVRL